jgi:anion-transporting  ArsA/GET3 family ATPase
VATAAPGVKEILTVGKIAWEVREDHYDMVVVDATATGHVVGQLASPVALAELVQVGAVRSQTEWMTNLLGDPAITGVVVVTTPEEMPVNETIELVNRLRAETEIDVAGVIANRCSIGSPLASERPRRCRASAIFSTPPKWPLICAAAEPSTSPGFGPACRRTSPLPFCRCSLCARTG